MKYKQLGTSGVLVSDLCLGTMIFGENNSHGTAEKDAIKIIHRYLDAGGNHIDTANVYADGSSEEIVGKAIKNHRHKVFLATKVRFSMGDELNDQGLSRYHIMTQVEASLKRLQTDTIDLYYMHCWDPLSPLEESLRAFDDLVKAGKVRYIGVSNFKAWQLMKTLATSDTNGLTRFIAGQYQYSLVKRDIEYEFIDLCITEGIGIVPWGPLGGGFLSGKYQPGKKPQEETAGRLAVMAEDTEEYWERRNTQRNWKIIETVGSIAQEREASPAQISLAWLRAKPFVSSIVIGARTMQQLEDNLKSAEIDLSSQEIEILDQASKMPELYPYRFIENYGKRKLSL